MQSSFLLTPKQAEYIRNAHHRWNVSCGAVRSGKSYLQISYLIPSRLLERKNYAKVFGVKVYCVGADKVSQVSKLRGSEISYCAVDEATDINEEVFEMLKSRLSLPWSCCDITTNPGRPTHWFKRFLDSREQGVDIYLQEYTIYDNPFLPLEYVHNLEAEYRGTVWYDRYILGLWTLAEGLIYPHFSKALEDTFLGLAEEYVISLDYGTSNPFAALLWAKKGSTWHVVNEYYYSGRAEGVQKTDGEYLEELERFAAPAIAAQQRVRSRSVFGMLGEPERISVIVDPSAASFIALLRQSKTLRPRSANNDVLNGIRNTSSAIQNGLIKVSRTCANWLEEAQSYVWDPNCEEDRPIKDNDHLMDAMRYFVETMRIVRPVDNYRSPLER